MSDRNAIGISGIWREEINRKEKSQDKQVPDAESWWVLLLVRWDETVGSQDLHKQYDQSK